LVADIELAKPPQNPIGASHPGIGAGRAGHVGTEAALSGSSEELKWAARLVGAGSLLTLIYELAYLGFDRAFLWMNGAWPLFLHLLNIGLYVVAVIMTLRVGPWMRRHWKAVAFSFSTILITSSMWLTIITGESEPLLVALMLFLAGTGPFLQWGERTQGLLSLVAIAAFTIAVTQSPHARSDPYQWLGILIAAAIGLSIARNIMESFGGRIAASNAPNRGAVFTLEFPITAHSDVDIRDNSRTGRAPIPT
jgi:hypothetical protein